MGLSQSWAIIVKSLKATYEHLGLAVVINVIWFFLWLSPMFLYAVSGLENITLFIIANMLSVVLFGPATAGAYALLNKIVNEGSTAISEYKGAFLKFFWRSLLLVLVCGLMFLFIILNIRVSLNSQVFLFQLIGGMWLYVLLFWCAMMQYVFPLLVQQNVGILTIIKRAALITLDNILLSLLILLASLVITFVSAFSMVLLVILWLSLIGLLQNFAFVQVLSKYDDGNGN